MVRNALKLGRIWGIEIGLDYSWFIVFALVSWMLATHYFPMNYRWPSATYWIVGLGTSLLFFGSVVAHELGHSWVALRQGIPVRAITLFIFGGVAQITREPKKPLDEFFIALAGPVVSLTLAALFGGLWLITGSPSQPLAALALWLGGINLTLAVFNMVPGFPLDGGRVLRSVIWALTGNFRRATGIASSVGRAVAYGFMLWGVWMALSGNLINGLWIGFIGLFLENAAVRNYEQAALSETLAGVKAREAMLLDCPKIPPTLTVEQLVNDYILRTTRRCFPVTDNGTVWGLITLSDVTKVPRERWAVTTVGQAMTPFEQLKRVSPDDSLSSVLELMTTEDINQVPVVENGQLVGMIARDNILLFLKLRTDRGAS